MNLGVHRLFTKSRNRRVPLQVHIRLLEQCNQRCSYCKGDYPVHGQDFPSTAQVIELVDELAQLGTRRITLFGGEPLLRDDIHDIVRRIKYHKIYSSVITNGKFIDKYKPLLKDLDQLSVSLDGDKSTHDTYRGQGTFDGAIHAIRIAREAGVPVQLLCTITRLTDRKLIYLMSIAEKYQCAVNFEQLNPFFNTDGSMTLRDEDVGWKEMSDFLDYHIRNKIPRVVHSLYVLKYVRNWPLSYNTFRLFRNEIPTRFKPIFCYGGIFSASIEANGDLLPCCMIRPDFKPTNVFRRGAKEAWRAMPRNDCITCRSIACNMMNALFSLHPSSLLHYARIYLENRLQRIYKGVKA